MKRNSEQEKQQKTEQNQNDDSNSISIEDDDSLYCSPKEKKEENYIEEECENKLSKYKRECVDFTLYDDQFEQNFMKERIKPYS